MSGCAEKELVKVVYYDGGEPRSVLGWWSDEGWAVKVMGPNGEWMLIPKRRLVKIVRSKTVMSKEQVFGKGKTEGAIN